jgi:hypothetical protein
MLRAPSGGLRDQLCGSGNGRFTIRTRQLKLSGSLSAADSGH